MLLKCRAVAERAGLDAEEFDLKIFRSTYATHMLRSCLNEVPATTNHREAELRAEPLLFGAPEESRGPVRNPRPSSRRFRAP
jgi:hypothetical protein